MMTKPKPVEYRLVKVIWQDSRHPYNGWQHVEDLEPIEPTICESVGWIVMEKLGSIMLAASITIDNDGNAQVSGVIDIPLRSVDTVIDLTDIPVR